MTSPQAVAKKLTRIAGEIARERGEMSLFALVLPEDSFGLWDLLVAAPWIGKNFDEAIGYVGKKLQKQLSGDDLILISRIAPIEEKHPLCDALRRAASLGMTSFLIRAGDVEIRGAHVISPKMAA